MVLGARHDRGMLAGTKGVPTVSTTPPAGRTKGCQKHLPNDPRLENGENGRSSRTKKPHRGHTRLWRALNNRLSACCKTGCTSDEDAPT
jgi:hypothetical protein